jgi:DNA-binding PucR family transcriptional regulator
MKDVLDWLDYRAQELDEDQLNAILGALAPATSALPEFWADADLVAEGNAATRELLRLMIVSALPEIATPVGGPPPAVLVSVVRMWARRGIELRVLMKGLRGAHTAMWRYWMVDVGNRIDDPTLRMAVLEHSWDRMSAWNEAQMEQLEAIYAEERERWLRGAHARRAEFVRSLLAGEPIGSEEATVALGHDLHRTHTALVLWVEGDAPEADTLAMLEEAARDVAAALGSSLAVSLPAGSHALWAWISTDAQPSQADWQTAAEMLLPAGVHIGAGRPSPGLEGFRTSHRDAQLVRRIMAFADPREGLVRFDDVELACIMSGEPETMRRLVANELGELARRDENAARLRETLRVYLECGANAREAATRLNMHKNTVHYRLARIEELLGRGIAERRLELEVALMLAHTLGDRVLPRAEPGA